MLPIDKMIITQNIYDGKMASKLVFYASQPLCLYQGDWQDGKLLSKRQRQQNQNKDQNI